MASDFLRLGVAFALGLLTGIQRESAYDDPERKLFAGARTFSLVSAVGFLAAMVSDLLDSALPYIAALLVGGALMVISYRDDVQKGRPGLTTEMSVLVTILSGALCYLDQMALAVATVVLMALFLSLKREFRLFAAAITREDVYATLKFAIISFVVLPILPDQTFGAFPIDVLNPRKIWLMVVFISGISFLGYLLIKIVGTAQGIGLTGILGGLASSTAVTLSMARRSKDSDERLSRALAMSIIMAWTVMYVRVFIVVYSLDAALGQKLILPFAIAAGLGLIYVVALAFIRNPLKAVHDLQFTNPFELGPTLRFGAIYAGVLMVTAVAEQSLGDSGLYVLSFISGLLDVDAIVLSIVDLLSRSTELAMNTAAQAVMIAAMANTLFKAVFALCIGSKRLRPVLLPGALLMILGGLVTVFLM